MASIKDHKSHELGLHQEVLTGRTQQVFFNPEEVENFYYHDSYDVDFNKRTSIDAEKLNCITVNKKIKELTEKNLWKKKEFFKSNYISSKDVNAWLGLYEVIK